MRKGVAMQMTIGLLFSVFAIALTWFVFIYRFPGAIPFGCDYDGICENSYTEKTFMYDNRLENEYLLFIPFSCWKTDCCYDFEHALDYCNVPEPPEYSEAWYYNTLDDTQRACIHSSNVEVLIDCGESRFNCENETCVQSCNYNDVCEPGETQNCYDCW